jgi:chromosome segregation ATPase
MIDMEKQYEKETGEKALYRMGCSDYHTLRYVSWLEAETRKAKSELKEEIARRWDGYTELVIACQNADERIEKLEAELAEMTADRDSEKQWVSEYHLDWVRDRDYAEKAKAENKRLNIELAKMEKAMSDRSRPRQAKTGGAFPCHGIPQSWKKNGLHI